MGVMLPTLREDRRKTYSPVLPISPTSGRVLQVPVEVVDAEAGLIAFDDEDGGRVTQSAFGGLAKLQWKVDWAARWVALDVDYEMSGKDLIDSVVQSGKIARILGGRPPEGFNYEMFLDEKGEKISKSKGNGLSLEEWLRYGSEESLAFYIFREPKRAKSLHIGVIPRAVDEYWQFREKYAEQPIDQKLGNPVHHIHAGKVPEGALPVTYGLLLNLVSLPGVADKDTAWKFVQRYAPGTSPEQRSRARRPDRPRGQLRARFRKRRPQAPPAEADGSGGPSRPRRRSWPSSRPTPRPRTSRRRCSRSASATRSRACAAGSRRSTKPCSAPRRARAWAASSRSTASTTAVASSPRRCPGNRTANIFRLSGRNERFRPGRTGPAPRFSRPVREARPAGRRRRPVGACHIVLRHRSGPLSRLRGRDSGFVRAIPVGRARRGGAGCRCDRRPRPARARACRIAAAGRTGRRDRLASDSNGWGSLRISIPSRSGCWSVWR